MQEQAISIELIKTCFQSEYYPALFSGQETNEPTLKFVGQLIHHTQNKELIKDIISSGLPEDYSGNTLMEIDKMVDGAIKKGFHEGPSKETEDKSGTASSKLLSVIDDAGDSISFFHDAYKRPYISIQDDDKGISHYALSSQSAKHALQRLFYKRYNRAIHGQGFSCFCEFSHHVGYAKAYKG